MVGLIVLLTSSIHPFVIARDQLKHGFIIKIINIFVYLEIQQLSLGF